MALKRRRTKRRALPILYSFLDICCLTTEFPRAKAADEFKESEDRFEDPGKERK